MEIFHEVWNGNLETELMRMEHAICFTDIIAIDTEYPGFVHYTCREASTLQVYDDLKFNVDRLNPIQFGFALIDCAGQIGGVWQFNFSDFDPHLNINDVDATTSLSVTKRKSGIDFEKQRRDGINSVIFARKFSRIVKNHTNLRWITFHGIYDVAYMAKVLTQTQLPPTSSGFETIIGEIFGSVYDIKFMARFYPGLNGGELGLKKLASILDVKWMGRSHQAGSDSFVTALVFLKMKEIYQMNERFYEGFLYGLGGKIQRRKPPPQPVFCQIQPPFQQPLVVRCLPSSGFHQGHAIYQRPSNYFLHI